MNNSKVRVLSCLLALSLSFSGVNSVGMYASAEELSSTTAQTKEGDSSEVTVLEEKSDSETIITETTDSDNDQKEQSIESSDEEKSDELKESDSDEGADESEVEEESESDEDDELDQDDDSEDDEDDGAKPLKLKKTSFSDIDGVSSATMSKYSGELEFKSAKSYGGLYEDKFEAAAYLLPEDGEDEEGAFVAAGYTFGASDDPDWDFAVNMEASPKYGHSYNEAIIVRFNKEHGVDWVWESDRVGVSYFLDVDVIKDGSIVAVGRVRDYESTRTALYIVKVNPNNPEDYTEYIINSTAGGGYELTGILPTDDGGFAISGYTAFGEGYIASKASGEASFSGKVQIWQNADGEDENLSKRVSNSGYNGLLMKFTKDMNIKFISFENYGVSEGVAASDYSSTAEMIYGLDMDADGNYITVGCTRLAKGITNAVISKWDGNTGELISHQMAGSSDSSKQGSIDLITAEYLSVAALADGSYVVTGTATNDATTSEAWKCYGSSDVVVVRYSADLSEVLYSRNIGTVDGLSGSLTATNGTRMEGIKATNDGGYVVFGTSNTTLVERDLLDEGYDWDNYGSNDGIIIKYDANNNVSWCKNYGTTGGDWIYDVIFRENETEITAVGQTSGQYGTPAWEWHGKAASSSNPYDAFVMCTNMYSEAYTEPKASSELSGVTWANGVYEGEGVGRGGIMVMQVTIENNRISAIECLSHSETTEGGDSSPFAKALSLFGTIIKKQSTEVDSISGATLTSAGIKSGVNNALAKASAQTVIDAIDKVANYTAAKTSNTGNINNVLAAINYYTSLTEYEREYVTNSDALFNVADIFGFEIVIDDLDSDDENQETIVDTTYNDTYWNLQSKYYSLINANAFSENNITGAGVKIGVIDSGIIGNSADLNYSHILAGWDYVNDVPMNDATAENNENLTDTQGHGTLVAGIISAVKDNNIGIAGLLSDVDLVPMRIGSGTNEEASITAARAIRDAVDKFGVDVITTSVSLADTKELQEAIKYATASGVIVVGASGNSGTANSLDDEYVYPASYDDVISVGAVDSLGAVRANSTKNDQVFVTAPGQQIVGLGLSANGYRCYIKSGTSYSSPIVSAMAAAAKQINKNITTDEFKKLLIKTSKDMGDEGYDNAYGYGVVDLAAFTQVLLEKTTKESASNTSNSSSDNGSSSITSSTASTIDDSVDDTNAMINSARATTSGNKKLSNNSSTAISEDSETQIADETIPKTGDVEKTDTVEDNSEELSDQSVENLQKKSKAPVVLLIFLGLVAIGGFAFIFIKKPFITKK